jgi:hypothetical protein
MSAVSAPQQQVIAISNSAQECPICMDTIEGLCNRVVTECGHAFHCSCLMQNAAHNGFGCPYCRTKMAEEPEEEEDGEDEEDDEVTVFDEDALTSFRMFHQRINGEEVEEEPAEEWEWVSIDGSDEDEDEDEEQDVMPTADYVAQKLTGRGITMEDLVKNILFQEHSNYGENYIDYNRRSSEVYGQFRAIISQFTPVAPSGPSPVTTEPTVSTPVAERSSIDIEPTAVEPPTIEPPTIAESKSVAVFRRREFMIHI